MLIPNSEQTISAPSRVGANLMLAKAPLIDLDDLLPDRTGHAYHAHLQRLRRHLKPLKWRTHGRQRRRDRAAARRQQLPRRVGGGRGRGSSRGRGAHRRAPQDREPQRLRHRQREERCDAHCRPSTIGAQDCREYSTARYVDRGRLIDWGHDFLHINFQ